MDVDEDEEGSQHVKRIPDYGIVVNFEGLDDDEREVMFLSSWQWCLMLTVSQDGSAEALADYDSSIAKLNSEIEHMAPNLKAMDRSVKD